MSKCDDMQVGEIYVCDDCGLELQVVKGCCEEGSEGTMCTCEPCAITCCGKELTLKS